MHVKKAPFTAEIGDGIERFDTLADLQRAMRQRVSCICSSAEWYRRMRSRHGAKVRDAAGGMVANVPHSAPQRLANGARRGDPPSVASQLRSRRHGFS